MIIWNVESALIELLIQIPNFSVVIVLSDQR